MSVDRWMDNEVGVHRHNGILLSHKKEHIWVSSNELDEAEKAMAPHSSTLAWKIPWMEEPGRLHAVHGVAKSRARLSDFTFAFHFHALEQEMATHSSILAWRIPETEEPSGLPSMGSHRVGHDWSDLAADPIIQSEVSQKEKDKDHFLMHIYRI